MTDDERISHLYRMAVGAHQRGVHPALRASVLAGIRAEVAKQPGVLDWLRRPALPYEAPASFATPEWGILAVAAVVFLLLGGIAAAALIKMAVPDGPLAVVHMGTPAINVSAGVTTMMALVAEIITSFFLVFAVCGTAVDKDAPKVGGLFIGLAVTMGILMAGPISGGAMNPARHLGPALLGGGLQDIWIYWVGPIVGGVLAATVFFRVIRSS